MAADSATAAILAGALTPMAAAATPRYVALAGLVALLTAAYLLLARVFRLGFLADFLSQTVLVGFLTGVGVQVGIAVLGEMLGLPIDAHRTVEQLAQVVQALPSAHLPTVAVSGAVVAVVLLCRAVAPRAPGALVAVVGALGASIQLDFAAQGIAVLGPVAGGLPQLALPDLPWHEVVPLLPIAGSCFLMIVAQSAATARAYALRHREALDENSELVGLAAANVAAALTGTFVVNGSPTQTAMVEAAGSRSQLAHLTTAAVVAAVLLFLTAPLAHLPACMLGAIVFTIAIGLVDLRGLLAIRRESPGEFRLAVVTALVVVGVGVEMGILLAMALSLLRHVRHSYLAHTAVLVEDADGIWHQVAAVAGAETAPGLVVLRFGADLFYANVGRFAATVRELVDGATTPLRWLVIDAGAITSIDYSAAREVAVLLDDLARRRVALFLVHAPPTLEADLARHRLRARIGADRVVPKLHEALARIRAHSTSG
ncbi:MAG: SulP family inorganic anion transporter [Candidatus Binatia bacterium]